MAPKLISMTYQQTPSLSDPAANKKKEFYFQNCWSRVCLSGWHVWSCLNCHRDFFWYWFFIFNASNCIPPCIAFWSSLLVAKLCQLKKTTRGTMSSISRSKFSIIPADSPMLTSLQFLRKCFYYIKNKPKFQEIHTSSQENFYQLAP